MKIPQWKWMLANFLSLGNALCGVGMSMVAHDYFQPNVHPNLNTGTWAIWPLPCDVRPCLMLLLVVSLLCDVMDGPAARRWGSTAIGPYCDASADAVSYGVSPAIALYYAIPGWGGAALAYVHVTCTITRLVVFVVNERVGKIETRTRTLWSQLAAQGQAPPPSPGLPPLSLSPAASLPENKTPGFAGLPSPLGASIVIASLVLCDASAQAMRGGAAFVPGAGAQYFQPIHTLLITMAVGVADVTMMSFDVPYAKFGAIPRRQLAIGSAVSVAAGAAIVYVLQLYGVFGSMGGGEFTAMVLLVESLIYAASPTTAFVWRLRTRANTIYAAHKLAVAATKQAAAAAPKAQHAD